MNNFSPVIQVKPFNSLIAVILVALILLINIFHSNELHAAERTSYSIDITENKESNDNTTLLLDSVIQEAPALVIEGGQQALSIITPTNQSYSTDPNLTNQITTNSYSHTFSIFDASVNLIHDDDYDGFYHHFSVTFDADVSAGSAIVYARMYISYNGGPWNYYYTSKTFEIIGVSDLDSHTVETIFTTGYFPGDYDIRIDLFETGLINPVAVIGPNEDYDLNYIPLEDEEHDFYTDVIVTDAGCSLSPDSEFDPVLPIMFLISLFYLIRRFYFKN